MRDYFRENYLKNFLSTVKLIKELLQENVKDEYDWLGRFTWVLFNCSLDGQETTESLQILKELWDNSTTKKYYNLLFLRNHNFSLNKQSESL